MTLKLTSIAAAAGVATAGVQLFWSLASGSYNAGSRMESVQTELKLLRSDVQSQSRLFQEQNKMYEFRLSQLEEKHTRKNERHN